LVTFVKKQIGYDAFLENLNLAFDVQMSLLDCSDGAKKGMGIIFSKVFIFRWTAIFSFLCKIALKTIKFFPLQLYSRKPRTQVFSIF
jgi:hypothetical protein